VSDLYILHSVKKDDFDIDKNYYGQNSIDRFGFIHCSDFDTYYLVAPNFKNESDERLLLVINTDKVNADIKWEDGGGVNFPHIYGLLNVDSVEEVLPHLWTENKIWIPNEELKKYVSDLKNISFFRKI
jgi:uncharacterized protein (DUF952 family)